MVSHPTNYHSPDTGSGPCIQNWYCKRIYAGHGQQIAGLSKPDLPDETIQRRDRRQPDSIVASQLMSS
jgi:hypothetical protein